MDPDRPSSPEPLARGGDSGLGRMRALLDRPLSREEIEETTAVVAAKPERLATRFRSVLVFRVGAERLALEADATHRVVPVTPVRRVPHRTNAVFAGIANVSGELTPVASIASALGVAPGGAATHFIVIGEAGARWAFAVDLVGGVRRVDAARTIDPPATVRHAADGCTGFLVPLEDDGREALVAVLDARRLAALFVRSLA